MSGGPTEVCGLRLDGPLSPVGRRTSGPADLVMNAGPVGDGAEHVARLDGSDDHGVSVRRVGQAVFVRFNGLADVALDMATGTATIDVCDGWPPGMAEVLAGGPVLALALALSGRPCLHASAVSIGGRAVAFAGRSGAGKTTLAALACLAGADLVADDTLAMDVDGAEVRCLPGSRELRLRPAPAELLAGTGWPRRTTADERVAVLVGSETLAATTLSAIVVPAVGVDHLESVERLEGAAASAALLGCSRLVALQIPDHAVAMLDLTSVLARRVPVYRVTMGRLTTASVPRPVQEVLEAHLGAVRISGRSR